MSIPTSVPFEILNHPQFQEFMKVQPASPDMLYREFLMQAGGSPAQLKDLLDTYSQRMDMVPKIGQVCVSMLRELSVNIHFDCNVSRLGIRIQDL